MGSRRTAATVRAEREPDARGVPPRERRTLGKVVFALGLIYIATTLLDGFRAGIGTPARYAGMAFVAVWLLMRLTDRHSLRIPRAASYPLALLVVWSLITVFWSWAPSRSLASAGTLLALALSAVAIADTYWDRLPAPAYALTVGGVIAGALTLATPPDTVEDGGDYVGRAAISGFDPNTLALYLVLATSAAIYCLILNPRASIKFALVIACLVLVAATIASGSKTGFGAVVGVGVIALFVSLRGVKSAVTAVVAIGAVLMLFSVMRSAGLIPTRLLAFIAAPVVNDARVEIIDQFRYFESIWQLQGVGIGADANFLLAVSGVYLNAHNFFWRVWIETGMIGLLAWGMVLYYVVRGGIKMKDKRWPLLALPPLVAFFYTLAPIYTKSVWVMFGIALTGYWTRRHAYSRRRRLRSDMPEHEAVGGRHD